METRRILEDEFHTAREGATPGGTPTVIIGGNFPAVGTAGTNTGDKSTLPRKRRLTTTSRMSIGDDPTMPIRIGDHREHGLTGVSGLTPKAQHMSTDALLKENERLRFELENAKSLQHVLENTMSDLRDQLVKEKLTHAKGAQGEVDGAPSPPDVQPDHTGGDESDAEYPEESNEDASGETVDEKDYRTVRIDLTNALEKVVSLETDISRLRLALSTAENSKDAVVQENEALRTALETAQTDVERAAEEKTELKAKIATLEGDAMQPCGVDRQNDDGNAFETSLELQLLRNKLSASQQTLADTTMSLEDARSKIRQLEQTLETQDNEHLSYLQTQDELAGWKSIFKHLDPNPTPNVLMNHIRDLESKLERAQLANARNPATSPKSPPNQSKLTTEDLENNVISLEQENLELHKRVKALNSKIEEVEAANAHLTHKLGNGAFNPETTKVLHLKRNPFADTKLAQMQVELDTLRGENQVLKARVAKHDDIGRLPDQGSDQAGHQVGYAQPTGDYPDHPLASLQLATLQGKLTATEKKLASSEKSTKRLQQVFSQQIATFRESIALLFGWNLDMTTDPNNRNSERARFTLSLRGQKHQRLCFRLTDQSQLTLIDTPFSKKHQKEIDTCIVAMNSIPLFIANLTLDHIQRM